MRTAMRYLLVTFLSTILIPGPAAAQYWSDCGCHEVEPACCSACGCEAVVTCDSCCSAAYMSEPVITSCGGEVADKVEAAEPVVAKPEQSPPEPAKTPASKEDPSPAEVSPPAAVAEPERTIPMTIDPVKEEPAVPAQPETSNLFDSPPAVATPSAAPQDVVPVQQPEQPETEVETTESFFDTPVEDPAPSTDEPAPAEESEPAEEDDPLDDLFSGLQMPAILSVAGGLDSRATRTWTDNTAKYQCEARLSGLSRGAVVLAQASGKISHVPLRRLSDNDLSFVYQQVVAKREFLAQLAEQEKLASVWTFVRRIPWLLFCAG